MIKIGTNPFASKNIIVEMKDILEVSSTDHDDIGYNENDIMHIVTIKSHIDQATGEHV